MLRRLITWFLIIILITIFSNALIINRTVGASFRTFREGHTQSHLSKLSIELGEFYLANESWIGAQESIMDYSQILGMRSVLVDMDSQIVASSADDEIGDYLFDVDWAEDVIPILHPRLDIPVGVLILAPNEELKQADAVFISQLFRSSLATAVLVGLVATAVSYFVSRSMIGPIARLKMATDQVINGNYDITIDTHQRDEVGYLGIAFKHMVGEIEKLEAVRRDLVLNVSHDFRTPLTVVNGYLEALQSDKIVDRRSAGVAFDKMALEINHLQTLISALNDVAALDAGYIPLKKQWSNLQNLIKQAIERMLQPSLEKQIEISTDIPSTSVELFVDRIKISQVIFNLLDNAVHYTPSRGEILVRLRETETAVQLAVLDNGEGIPLDIQPFIFERFFRQNQSLNRELTGYGMGLSIARSIVQAHNGNIQVESSGQVGAGALFIVELPK
ncbi:MAG: HAMP domain-containing sensor histidine kinase [Chloroflexota bacterium]